MLVFSIGFAQTKNLWTEESPENLLLFQKNTKNVLQKERRVYKLDLAQLKQQLQRTTISEKTTFKKTEVILSFPDKDGEFQAYKIMESSTLSPELQRRYPNIRSYIGESNDSLKTIIRFSLSNLGLHVMKLTGGGNSEFTDPYTKDALTYVVYSKRDIEISSNYICKVIDNEQGNIKSEITESAKSNTKDGQLRTFRLALSCTGEYSRFHLDDQNISDSASETKKKEAVLSAMNISITRINGVFEKEMALTMQLVANNDDLIFLDPDTDGYTSDDDFQMLDEVQAKCDVIIGFSNYDIGHLFSTGFSGAAILNSPCTSSKAQAVSGRTPANGDSFDIDYVAHEMGHQFGATHTFNNSCGNNISTSTSVEPGSGTTIMSYAGICSPNIQNHSDDYFHAVSLEQMYNNIAYGNSTCAEQSDIGNTPPTANAGIDYSIPASTPFVLTGNGTSGTGSLNYCWEQIDTQESTMPPESSSIGGPLFRSFIGNTTSNKRHFPAIETTLLGNTGSTWEQLASVSRNLKFRLTTRDNGSPIGQFDFDDIIITVTNTNKSFEVTSQSNTEVLYTGESEIITWVVADTNLSPINTNYVNILFSSDGGLTFPTTLASNVLNNGSYSIIIPNITTTEARIKVEAVDNIFYNINSSDFTIEISKFVMIVTESSQNTCAPNDAVYEFEYITYQNFNETTTFYASDLPEGTTAAFSPATATADATMVTLTISNITESLSGVYQPILTGTSISETNNVNLNLTVDTNITTIPYLSYPENHAYSLSSEIEFTWDTETEINSYFIEISTDVEFDNLTEFSITDFKNYTALNLEENKTYYWRIREINSCNTGNNSIIYKFKTGLIEEFNFDNTENTNIPDNDSRGISSVIYINDNIEISDIKITINIDHRYIGDLNISLRNPEGEEIMLVENSSQEGANYTNTTFDDEADKTIFEGSPPYTGSFRPKEALSVFKKTQSLGEWTLNISDIELEDEGSLENWEIIIQGIDQNSQSDGGQLTNNTPKITKAFSPNNDGINDFWTIENINTTGYSSDKFPYANVRIFNIRGQLIYQSNNYKNDWNAIGTNGQKLPIGTYIYEIKFSYPEFKTQKGWLYIKY